MRKYFFLLLLALPAMAGAQTLLKNTSVSVYNTLRTIKPLGFEPLMQFDTTNAKLYVYAYGQWRLLADTVPDFSGSWSALTGVPAGFADGTDDVNDADASATNELQTLSIAGSNLSISGGNTVTLPQFSLSTSTLSASGETSLSVRYSGAAAPTLAKNAAGDFTLTVPSGTVLLGLYWTANNTNLTASNTIRLTLASADGQKLYGVYQVLNAATGEAFGELAGIVTKQTNPSAGNVLLEIPNMGSFGATGFIIVGKPY